MEQLKKINANIRWKQIGRSIIGPAAVLFGMILIEKYTYQKGITDGQKAICDVFPEEYASMTAKICGVFEKE